MLVEWQTFDKTGYDATVKMYPEETKLKDFTYTHKGKVLEVRHEQPSFLRKGKTVYIVENLKTNQIQEVNATDCKVIYKIN